MLADVTAKPDPTGLPGSNVLQQLVNGAEAWALAIALLGAFIGAALWAVASHTHNHHYAARGRMAALISAAAALVVGAAPGLVNFFEHLGTTAQDAAAGVVFVTVPSPSRGALAPAAPASAASSREPGVRRRRRVQRAIGKACEGMSNRAGCSAPARSC